MEYNVCVDLKLTPDTRRHVILILCHTNTTLEQNLSYPVTLSNIYIKETWTRCTLIKQYKIRS